MKPFSLKYHLIFVLTVSILMTFNSIEMKAQKQFSDVVVLKNGSTIHGKIVELDSVGRLRVQTSNSELLIEKSEILNFKIEGEEKDGPIGKKRRFINITQLGILAGNRMADPFGGFYNSPEYASLSMESFNGFRFNQNISAGATAGIDVYEEGILFPLGGSIRFNYLNKRITPTSFLTGGYSLSWPQKNIEMREFKGGFFYTPGIGLLIRNINGSAFTINIGYKSQHAVLRRGNSQWWRDVQERNYRRLSFMIGFSF